MSRLFKLLCAIQLIGLSSLQSGASPTQQAKLVVQTKECIQGVLMHPIHAEVTIFDVSEVPEIMRLAKQFEDNSSPTDQEGAEKMLSIYDSLQKRIEATPALARLKRLPGSKHTFQFPTVRRVVVFAFGESEGELTSYAKQEVNIVPNRTNEAILNFSTKEECENAK